MLFIFLGLRIVSLEDTYLPFANYYSDSIHGYLQVFQKKTWSSIKYLLYKDVLKVCSFFFFNYGTMTVTDKLNYGFTEELTIDTINCPTNATNSYHCQVIYKE